MDDGQLYAQGFRFVVTKNGRDAAHTTTQREAEQEARRIGGEAHLMVPSTQAHAVSLRRNPPEGFGHVIESTPESFRNVVREYGQSEEWREFWWREAIQNSVDALREAGKLTTGVIKCEAHEEPDGRSWRVSCEDNGTGMAEQVLLRNFLTIGGTGKKDETGSVGGFGEAKKLLLLPWSSWSVRSHNYLAHGAGMHFKIDRGLPHFEGLKLEVVMPRIKHENRWMFTTDTFATNFIRKCNLPKTTFLVNGRKVEAILKAPGAKPDEPDEGSDDGVVKKKENENNYEVPLVDEEGKTVRTVQVGYKICYQKPGKAADANYWPFYRGKAIVRGGGIFMFEIDGAWEAPGQIIVELHGAAKYVLNPTRTQIANSKIATDLRRFFNKIVKDPLSALEGLGAVKPQIWSGTGKFSAKQLQKRAVERADVIWNWDTPVPDEPKKLDEQQVDKLDDILKDVQEEAKREEEHTPPETRRLPSAGPDVAHDMLRPVEFKNEKQFKAAVKQLAWRPDFMIFNKLTGTSDYNVEEDDRGESEKWKTPVRFKPENMTKPVRRLVRVWAELCRFVLIQLGATDEYGVGFIFSHKISGLTYRNKEDGSKWLLINPFKDRSAVDEDSGFVGFKQMWDVKSIPDIKYIYSVAVHECTHLYNGISGHDEIFSSAMTQNVAQCADGWKYVNRIVKKVTGDDEFSVSSEQGKVIWEEDQEEDPEAHFEKLKAAVKRKKAELAKLESGDPAKLYKDRDIPKELGRLKPWPKVDSLYGQVNAKTRAAAEELIAQCKALAPQVPNEFSGRFHVELETLERELKDSYCEEDYCRQRIRKLRAVRDEAFPPPYALNELGVHRPWPPMSTGDKVSDATRKAARRLVDEIRAWHPEDKRNSDGEIPWRIRNRLENLDYNIAQKDPVSEGMFRERMVEIREMRDADLPAKQEQVGQQAELNRLRHEHDNQVREAERLRRERDEHALDLLAQAKRSSSFEAQAQEQAARVAELEAQMQELLLEGQRVQTEAHRRVQTEQARWAVSSSKIVWQNPVRRGSVYVWDGTRDGARACSVAWQKDKGATLVLLDGTERAFETSGEAKKFAQENV